MIILLLHHSKEGGASNWACASIWHYTVYATMKILGILGILLTFSTVVVTFFTKTYETTFFNVGYILMIQRDTLDTGNTFKEAEAYYRSSLVIEIATEVCT